MHMYLVPAYILIPKKEVNDVCSTEFTSFNKTGAVVLTSFILEIQKKIDLFF